MPIPIECEQCCNKLTVPDSVAGKVGKCPKCGNRIAIPNFENPPEVVVSSSRATASKGNYALVGMVVGIVACVLFTLGILALTSNPHSPVVVDQTATSPPTQLEADEIREPEVVPAVSAPPQGFGVSLAQFKEDVPVGVAWRVLNESTNEDGRVSYQLLSTKLTNVMLIAAGSSDELREVSLTFAVKADMSEADAFTRVALMIYFATKYSNWTEDEIGVFWQRLLKVGAGEDVQCKIQKDGHTFWLTPMGVADGTMFMTGVGVDPESDAPTLQQWLDSHPIPTGPILNKHSDKGGRVTNKQFAFKGLRRKSNGTFIGEMTNNTDQRFQFVAFKMSIYDQNAELLDTGPIVFTDFAPGQTRSFETYIESVPAEYLYKIDFENGL